MHFDIQSAILWVQEERKSSRVSKKHCDRLFSALNPKNLQSELGASGLKGICALQLSDERPDANSALKGFAVVEIHLMVNLICRCSGGSEGAYSSYDLSWGGKRRVSSRIESRQARQHNFSGS